MRRLALVLLGVLLVTPACGRHGEETAERREQAGEPESREAAAPDTLLRIDPEMMRDLRITTAAVEQRPAGEGVTVLGELGVNEDAYAEVASPMPARVTDVQAAVGTQVLPGQAMAELQSVDLGKARAEYLTAQARAELTKKTLERKRSLAGERIVPQREVQEAEAASSSADAELRAATAALRALGVSDDHAAPDADTSRFVLRSPIAGVVIEREAVRGQLADPGHALFRVADLGTLWLTVHAFERDAVRVRVGASAEVSFAAIPGRRSPGRVTLVGRRVDPASRTIPVRIDLPNDDGSLRPGMSATARLALGDETTTIVAVPGASLQRLHQGWCVFLPKSEGAFEVRPVGRGRDLSGEVEVVSGLAPGETVVVDGAFLLKAEAERSRGEGEHHEH
jgi:cobalt-zinc-cadmium efflux system membrane fusion protein